MSGPPHLTEAAEARFWDGLEATGRFFMGEADVQKALAKLVRTVDEYGIHHRTHFFPRHYSSGCANGAQNYLLGPRRGQSATFRSLVASARRRFQTPSARSTPENPRTKTSRPRRLRRLRGLACVRGAVSRREQSSASGDRQRRGPMDTFRGVETEISPRAAMPCLDTTGRFIDDTPLRQA